MPTKHAFAEQKRKKSSPNTDICEICTVAMKYLDDILKDNYTEAAVKEGLDKLCGLLPPSLKGEVYESFFYYVLIILMFIISNCCYIQHFLCIVHNFD